MRWVTSPSGTETVPLVELASASLIARPPRAVLNVRGLSTLHDWIVAGNVDFDGVSYYAHFLTFLGRFFGLDVRGLFFGGGARGLGGFYGFVFCDLVVVA